MPRRVLAGVACVLLTSVGFAKGAEPSVLVTRSGPWTVVDSANFRVCAIAAEADVRELCQRCERTRGELCEKWLGPAVAGPWSLRCHVVLHPTAESYLREVGQGQMTAGSSLIEFEGTTMVTRRVDLRADHPDGFADALAHELTHVVVADRFTELQIPRWADEGMAVLADSPKKQAAHHADLQAARNARKMFRLVELVELEQYPSAAEQATFYGQSASLVRYLVEQRGAREFLAFVDLATRVGYERALREHYQIDGLAGLERTWNRKLDAAEVAVVRPVGAVRGARSGL